MTELIPNNVRLRLVSAGRLQHDPARNVYLLLLPERVVKLNHTAFVLLSLSDGTRTVEDLLKSLILDFGADPKYQEEARIFLLDALSRGWIEISSNRNESQLLDRANSNSEKVLGHESEGAVSDLEKAAATLDVSIASAGEKTATARFAASVPRVCAAVGSEIRPVSIQPPFGLIAELTHRCPLQCLYCSNPVALIKEGAELSTEEWLDVIRQAKDLGVVEIHLSGGEPLIRPDLVEIVRTCTDLGVYSNLITSGIGLTEERVLELKGAGLCSVQLSFQSDDDETSRTIAGVNALQVKRASARLLSEAGLPLTTNVVLSALNINRLDSIMKLCTSYGASRIEIANCQYYGWALANRAALLPTRSQIDDAKTIIDRWRAELDESAIEIVWVVPDYFQDYPKPCSGGWAQRQLMVMPDGTALPCAAAKQITGLDFPNVRGERLSWIWKESDTFNRYRGYDWMKEPCASCERKEIDFGGCRCQAFLLTGDATEADPVCARSAKRPLVDAIAADCRIDALAPSRYRRFL